MKKNNKGFTLVELLAVIVVLAIVMLVATRAVTTQMANSRGSSLMVEAQAIQRDLNAICMLRNVVTEKEVKAAVGETKQLTYKSTVEGNDKAFEMAAIEGGNFANISAETAAPNNTIKIKNDIGKDDTTIAIPTIEISLDCPIK